MISIHALRVEGDAFAHLRRDPVPYFYPRPPGGGRHEGPENEQIEYLFLSTPSGWRATASLKRLYCFGVLFLSTPSGWRATSQLANQVFKCDISIHALRVEGDSIPYSHTPFGLISIHALRVEGDTQKIKIPKRRAG